MFEFDPAKSAVNRKKHGVDFTEALVLWENFHVIIPAKDVSGENRSAILGLIRGKIYMAIFTRRRGRVRLISCHRADKKWEGLYHDFKKKG